MQNRLIGLAIIGQLAFCPMARAFELQECDSNLEGMVIARPGMHRLLTKHTDEASGYVLDKTDKVFKAKGGLMRVFHRTKAAELDVSRADTTFDQ